MTRAQIYRDCVTKQVIDKLQQRVGGHPSTLQLDHEYQTQVQTVYIEKPVHKSPIVKDMSNHLLMGKRKPKAYQTPSIRQILNKMEKDEKKLEQQRNSLLQEYNAGGQDFETALNHRMMEYKRFAERDSSAKGYQHKENVIDYNYRQMKEVGNQDLMLPDIFDRTVRSGSNLMDTHKFNELAK